MYVQHVVTEMDETRLQRCVICGEVITDYRQVLWASGDPGPIGFGAGRVYVRKGCPTITTTITPDETVTPCTKNQ